MNKQTNDVLIMEMKRKLSIPPKQKKLTIEGLIMDDDEYDINFDDEPNFKSENQPIDDDLSSDSFQIEEDVKPIINKIRLMTIQAIAKLAEHPECETYQFLKKIWQFIDKGADIEKKDFDNKKIEKK